MTTRMPHNKGYLCYLNSLLAILKRTPEIETHIKKSYSKTNSDPRQKLKAILIAMNANNTKPKERPNTEPFAIQVN